MQHSKNADEMRWAIKLSATISEHLNPLTHHRSLSYQWHWHCGLRHNRHYTEETESKHTDSQNVEYLGTPDNLRFISLHIRSMWETTVMHKQVSGCTVNFGPDFPVYPFLELKTRIPPPPPISENFRFGMTKVYSGIPPPPPKIVRESKSEIFRIPRVTTCGDFIQPG